ncbi:MAG: hypothetical protein GY731_14060, partial [Gammaproteobacteria bacterium]|nr:hypothetical protein [Gammaproteobacteria bacterium]
DGSVTTFQYNLENRLSEVNTGSTAASYYYDPAGRRLSKVVNGVRTWYHYSDEGLVAEFDDQGNLLRSYGWYPDGVWNTDPLLLSEADKHYFYHNDHLDTPQQLTDLQGNIVWQAQYDSFGQVQISTELVTNNFRFPGQYYDAESGLYYNWYRYYNPKTGRYLIADPIGLNGGINLYAYTYADPVNWVDPYGQSPWSIIVKQGLKKGIKEG